MKAQIELETMGKTVILRAGDPPQTIAAGNVKTACSGLREWIADRMEFEDTKAEFAKPMTLVEALDDADRTVTK